MTIFLVGGGSGGHVYPNLALYPELSKIDANIHYIGERNSLEEQLCKDVGITFHPIHAGKMRRYFSFQNILDWFKIPLGCIESLKLLIQHKPKVVFSKGGYVSVPVCFATWLLRIPLIIHDSDVVPGLATKITSRFATKICVTWQKTLVFFPESKTMLTGIPVRQEICEGSKERGRTFLQVPSNALPVLLVVGGSLGAEGLNTFVMNNIKELTTHYNVVHITGVGKLGKEATETGGGWYKQLEIVQQEYPDILALADIILSRSGATALAEFAAVGKPTLLVPLPRSASRGDQFDNAEEYKKLYPGLAAIVEQEQLTLELCESKILDLLKTSLHYEIKNTAVQKITEIILELHKS